MANLHSIPGRRVSRRDLLRLGAAGGATAVLGGCGGGSPSGSAVPAAGTAGGVTLSYMSHPGQILPIITHQIDYLRQEHGVEIRTLESPDPTSYQDALKDHRAGGGRYDILMHYPRHNGDLAAVGALAPLDDLISRHDAGALFDGIVDAYRILYTRWGGSTIGVPVDGDVAMLYYRKDAFENPDYARKFREKFDAELKVPRTWDEFLRAAEFFTGWEWGASGQPGYGFQTSTWDRAYADQQWAPMMASAGGNWLTSDLRPGWNNPAGVRALQDLKSLLDFTPPDSISLSWNHTMETVFSNDVALVLWYMDLGRLGGAPDSWFAKSGGPEKLARFGYAPWPGYEVGGVYRNFNSMFYGRVLGMSSHSKHPDAAFQVLKTMLIPERRALSLDDAQSGSDMYLKSDYEPETFKTLQPTPEFLDAARQVISNGFPEMQLPGAGEYMDALQGALHGYLTGTETDAARALNAAADRWEAITERWKRPQQQEYWNEVLGRYREAGLKLGSL